MAGSGNGGGFFKLIGVIAIIALLIMFGNSNSGGSGNTSSNTHTSQSSSTYQGSTTTSADPDAKLTPQTRPQTGTILDGSEGGYAGVQVNAAPNASAYVKVKDMSGYTVVGFFVNAGSNAQIYVPEGTYNIQFAMGETWYGKSNRFGSKTSFGQDSSVSLGYGDVITYTLQPTSSGNFSMQSLDGSQF